MGAFEVETTIHAPIAAVWERLAGDVGAIAEWNPGVQESYTLGSKKTGLGAKRHCELGGNYLTEDVVEFVFERAISFRIMETDLPFARAVIRFTLESVLSTDTRVRVSPDYKLKYGCLGEHLDWCMVQSTYRKGMTNLLAGLKKDVETEQ